MQPKRGGLKPWHVRRNSEVLPVIPRIKIASLALKRQDSSLGLVQFFVFVFALPYIYTTASVHALQAFLTLARAVAPQLLSDQLRGTTPETTEI